MIVEQGNKIMRGKELVNNQGQIVDQENFNKALFSLMDERFKGGMEKQANSLKGLWSTVTGVAKTTLATLAGISATGEITAGGIFDTIKNGIKGVVDKLNEWQQNGQLQAWATTAQESLSSFWGVASIVFNGIVTAGKWIIDNWGLISPILAGVLAGFMAYQAATAVITAVKFAQAGLNLVMSLNPIGLLIVAIAALTIAGVALYKNWDKITGFFTNMWKSTIGFVTNTWNTFLSFTVDFWRRFGEAVVAAFVWLYDKNYYFQWLVDAIKDAWDYISTITSEVWSTISSWLTDLWDRIYKSAQTKWLAIKGVFDDITDHIKGIFDGLVKNAFDWGSNFLQNFIDGIRNMIDKLKETVGSVADTVAGYLGFHSPAKLGPGRDADKWAPNFVKMYAEGIQSMMPTLRSSLVDMSLSLHPGAAAISSSGGNGPITINIYGHNYEEIASKLKRDLARAGIKGVL